MSAKLTFRYACDECGRQNKCTGHWQGKVGPKVHDFYCPDCEVTFAELSSFDDHTQKVNPVAHECGEICQMIWLKAPGFAIDQFSATGLELHGQRFHRRSEVLDHLQGLSDKTHETREKPKVPDYRGRIKDVVERVTAKAKAGDLPPPEVKRDKFIQEIETKLTK